MSIILKTRNGNGITFTGKCDDIVDINDVTEHSANKAWRANSEKSVDEERELVKESIRVSGLREAVTMYANSSMIISGHTRTELLRELGCLEVPVVRLQRTPDMIGQFGQDSEIDPMHEDVLKEHGISNTRVNTTVFGRYGYAREIMAARIHDFDGRLEAKGQITQKDKLRIIKQAGIGSGSFDSIERIRFGYTKNIKNKECFIPPRFDLYNDLGNPQKDYTVRQLEKIQFVDFRTQNFSDHFPRQDFMDDVMETLEFANVIRAVNQQLTSMSEVANTSQYIGVNWFNETDDNFISASVHHMVCAYTCVEINKKFEEFGFDYVASQGKQQSHYDILIKDRDANDVSSIEVKNTFGRTEWSSGSNKTGYALLFAYNKERDRYFAASAYLDTGDWEGGVKGKFTLKAKTIHIKDDANYYMGDIDLDNDTYRIQKHRL
jgi:hypothetical protein